MYHAVIWIDHREARVFHFTPDQVETLVLHFDQTMRHVLHKDKSLGSGSASSDRDYLQAVAQSVSDAKGILIVGPANAKLELIKHIARHDPRLMPAIAGIETVDHPTDPQIVAYARHYFRASDRMTSVQ